MNQFNPCTRYCFTWLIDTLKIGTWKNTSRNLYREVRILIVSDPQLSRRPRTEKGWIEINVLGRRGGLCCTYFCEAFSTIQNEEIDCRIIVRHSISYHRGAYRCEVFVCYVFFCDIHLIVVNPLFYFEKIGISLTAHLLWWNCWPSLVVSAVEIYLFFGVQGMLKVNSKQHFKSSRNVMSF